MSGAGRSRTAAALEDLDWYVVDNLPPRMLAALARMMTPAGGGVHRLAAVVDVRSRRVLRRARRRPRRAAPAGHRLPHRLPRRHRRRARAALRVGAPPAPAAGRRPAPRRHHRRAPAPRRTCGAAPTSSSTPPICPSTTSPARSASSSPARSERPLRLTVVSFGFKYGLPLDADHVVDVRFLTNPYWVSELRHLTGQDEAVRDYVLGQDGASAFADRYVDALAPVLDGYINELKPFVTIAVGCTGGKHRSVAMAEAIAAAAARARPVRPHPAPGPGARVSGRRPRRGGRQPGAAGPRAARDARRPAAARARCAAGSSRAHADPPSSRSAAGTGWRPPSARCGTSPSNLTAVVTVADDGGSSGRLRQELGVLPPGDLRMALLGAVRRRRVGPDLARRPPAPVRLGRAAEQPRGGQPAHRGAVGAARRRGRRPRLGRPAARRARPGAAHGGRAAGDRGHRGATTAGQRTVARPVPRGGDRGRRRATSSCSRRTHRPAPRRCAAVRAADWVVLGPGLLVHLGHPAPHGPRARRGPAHHARPPRAHPQPRPRRRARPRA